jgi:hypothetical protein
MSMEIKGKCIQLLPLVTGMGQKGQWKKQSFILEFGDQYPKKVCLSIWGDMIPYPTVGDNLTCSINAESREYNGKWYTEIRVWKIEGVTIGQRGGNLPVDDNDPFDSLPKSASSAPAASNDPFSDLPF